MIIRTNYIQKIFYTGQISKDFILMYCFYGILYQEKDIV